jgi:hypothetical protein
MCCVGLDCKWEQEAGHGKESSACEAPDERTEANQEGEEACSRETG